LLEGAVHVIVEPAATALLPATEVGAFGTLAGIADELAADAADVPTAFVAVTVKV
jgi:hypothetical protein